MNPHMHMVALDPPGRSNRRWRCLFCKVEGPLAELRARACSFVYPPCSECGQTPECAPDCPGIVAALAGAGAHVGDKKGRS